MEPTLSEVRHSGDMAKVVPYPKVRFESPPLVRVRSTALAPW